jgi:hypothetical protein
MKKWVGLFLIGTMFFSSLAFAFLSGFSKQELGDQGAAPQNEALPTDPIVDYKLSPVQFEQAMAVGMTVATYRYEKTCIECVDQRAVLERLILSQDFNGQVILEEVESTGPPSLEINSYTGGRLLDSISQESEIQAFCEFVASPPLGCVTRQNLTAKGSLVQ